VSRFVLGYCGAVTSAVGIAVSLLHAIFLSSKAAASTH